MAKRRSGAKARGFSADRPQAVARRPAGGMSSKRPAVAERRETVNVYGGGEVGGRGTGRGMMSGARNVAEKGGRTAKGAAEATVGAARELAAGAAGIAGNVASRAGELGSQVAGRVRENPWPSILIGAGATWLAIGAMRGHSEEEDEPITNVRGNWRRTTGRGNERSRVGQAVAKVASAGRAAGGQIEDFVRERPLLAGAATLGLGVAVGMAIPSSAAENQMFGEARDRIVSRARDAARGTMDKVRDVADSVERIGPFGGGTRGSRGTRG